MQPLELGVRSVGLWAPGYAHAQAWLESRLDEQLETPPCRWLDARLRRGTSLVTRILAEALAQAVFRANVDPAEVATVYASRHGEIETMCSLLDMIYTDGEPSPARFKNSVHNAASGLVSIGCSNRAFTTAIAGGARTFEAAMLEAWSVLATSELPHVAVTIADEAVPEALDPASTRTPLAVALLLSRTELRDAPGPCRLGDLSRPHRPASYDLSGYPVFGSNPAQDALPLAHAALTGFCGSVPLAPGCDDSYCVTIAPFA